MNLTMDVLLAELERLFSLDEMTSMSKRLLGLDPGEIGGSTAKASFARALAQSCVEGDRVDALVEVMLASRPGVDPRIRELAPGVLPEELRAGERFGAFEIVRKLGESPLAIVYGARRDRGEGVLKVLRRDACRDARAVQRFLAVTRMVAELDHPGLPRWLEVGEAGEPHTRVWVSYEAGGSQPLSVALARSGPVPFVDLRPLLRAVLEALAALHAARIAHGSLKLENVLLEPGPQGSPRITLVDVGTDRLRPRAAVANGHSGLLAVFGSPKTIAPEQVRGLRADPSTDVYAFGAMLYEMLTGGPIFTAASAADAAFGHLTLAPEAPSVRAPAGWVSRDVDQFVLRLLAKESDRRPRDAAALLDTLEVLGRGPGSIRPPAGPAFPDDELTGLVDALIATPENEDAVVALEHAIEDGAEPLAVAEGFEVAADAVAGDDEAAVTLKKSLLARAGRLFEAAGDQLARAERVYVAALELDPRDTASHVALEVVRKGLGKFDEVVESLIARSELASPGEERSRIFAEIGRICSAELSDSNQAILAYARALCETPGKRELADEIERLAEDEEPLWNEVMATITAGVQNGELSSRDRNRLLVYAGRWANQKLGRRDVALMAYQQILATDPTHEEAHGEIAALYRKGQQWPELAEALEARAAATREAPRARDLRAEAATLLDLQLNDAARASAIYEEILAEDPGHAKAAEGLATIAERAGDYAKLAAIYARRAEARSGREKVDAWVKLGEVHEQQLENLSEAARCYEAALALDPAETRALKGLDRIYNRTGKYRELLDNLRRQAESAASPRQRIHVYERMASLHEEEFLDHAAAAECLEEVLAIEPANESALAKLPRLYRALGQWEPLQDLYRRHAKRVDDPDRRVGLLIERARVLSDQIGSPDRATRVYEEILELRSEHAGALDALARLREQSGDAQAALQAIEALAASAPTPAAKAEQWQRAARLLEAHGDRDAAIERYKMALEVAPDDRDAAAALKGAYAARGDAASVVVIIERELELEQGRLARARLKAELARVLREHLHDNDLAEANARTALEFDPTNADALLVLGDIAYENERYAEASRHLEPLVARAPSMAEEDAVRVLVRFIEAYGRSIAPTASPDRSSPSVAAEANPRLAGAVAALERLTAVDGPALGRVGRVLFECNDAAGARRLFERVLERHVPELDPAELADAEWRLGEIFRQSGELDRAVDLLRDAADIDPANPAPLAALARVFEETGDWEEFTRTKQRRLEMASGAERFDLLVEIGDAEFRKLNDRKRASRSYLAALEERPDDRKLLTKLMELFSEEKDWASLVDVVLRLADFVADPKQRAKYMHTAAKVTARQLGNVEQAIEYYDRALEFDPTLAKAVDEVIELRRNKGDYDAVERLLNTQLEQAKQMQDQGRMVHVLDQLGELYQKSLNEPELAIDAYEAAQAFDAEGKGRTEILAELYASDVTTYLDKAVSAQAQILRANPYRVESYKLLRRLYTEARRPDPAWCLCQALVVLGLAEADEERFYRRHRADNAAPAQTTLDEGDWASRLAHPEADPLLTTIFALIEPTIVRARTQPLEALGISPAHRVDLATEPYPICQTLYYAQGVLGFGAPPVYSNANDPAGLGFLHASEPAIVLGSAAFEQEIGNQSLAFIAGRHLTYFRPGYYVRHLVPTGTGLKGWLFAAVKHCVPQFPIAQDVQGQVNEALGYIAADFQGIQRERLASTVSKLLQSGGAIDLKRWVAGIDLTADRAGLLLAHDLATATNVMRATEDASSAPAKDRVKEAVLYSISAPYLELREKLQIAIDS